MKKILFRFSTIAALMAFVQGPAVQAANGSNLQTEVRHELLTLGPYSVFDNISYRVDGTKVTLFGQVTQPVVKDDAESAVKHVEGVTSVVDEIEVLPVSSMDDEIRRAVYRAVYSDPALSRYSFQSIPSIHIIVKNGNVSLEGFVANEGDRNAANIRAQSVGGVFAVKNNLRLDTK